MKLTEILFGKKEEQLMSEYQKKINDLKNNSSLTSTEKKQKLKEIYRQAKGVITKQSNQEELDRIYQEDKNYYEKKWKKKQEEKKDKEKNN